MKVTEVPAQISLSDASIERLTGRIGLTVTVVSAEFSAAHTPLLTTALYEVVAVNTPGAKVVPEFSKSVHSVPSSDDCHLRIVPVCVPRVRMPLV